MGDFGNLNELENACLTCTKCELHQTRTNIVFGVGSSKPKVLFIGEGPGEKEDQRGEPFVGRSGELLDEMLKTIGLSRKENIYIANIVKCRPPGNRDPHRAEREACIGWLRAQIKLLHPKIVVCLGRIAACEIIDSNLKITLDHGKWYEVDSIKYMALFHPAALLRDPSKKPDTFADLKELEKMIKQIG